jgi:hypothetical protein
MSNYSTKSQCAHAKLGSNDILELYPIMERALLHNKHNRFQTSAEFSAALEAAIIW